MARELFGTFGKNLFIPTHQELFEKLPSPERLVIIFITLQNRFLFFSTFLLIYTV